MRHLAQHTLAARGRHDSAEQRIAVAQVSVVQEPWGHCAGARRHSERLKLLYQGNLENSFSDFLHTCLWGGGEKGYMTAQHIYQLLVFSLVGHMYRRDGCCGVGAAGERCSEAG